MSAAGITFWPAKRNRVLHSSSGLGRSHRAGMIMRETLESLEARLDPAGFARIHRSVIVNVDRSAYLEPIAHGEYLVTLRDGRTLYPTRSFSRRLRHRLRCDLITGRSDGNNGEICTSKTLA
jgi:hypothetical protein